MRDLIKVFWLFTYGARPFMQTHPHFLQQVFPKCNTKHFSITACGKEKVRKPPDVFLMQIQGTTHACSEQEAERQSQAGCCPANIITILPAQNGPCSPHTSQNKLYSRKGWGKPQPLGTGQISPRRPPVSNLTRTFPHSQLSLFHTKSRRKQMSPQAFDSE